MPTDTPAPDDYDATAADELRDRLQQLLEDVVSTITDIVMCRLAADDAK